MKLLIVRHGDPDYEKDSLTEKGFREVEFLSQKLSRLDIKAIYCSPLGRAKDTAKPTLEKTNMTATICDWLMEFPAYMVDSVTNEKISLWDMLPNVWTNHPLLYDKDKWVEDELIKSGNGEELYKNVSQQLDLLLENHGYKREKNYYLAENSNSDTIILFCHFGVECVLLSHLLGISPYPLWHGAVALPSSVTTLITEERQDGIVNFRMNGFGDISHLYANNEPPAFAARFCECYKNTDERH